MLHFLREVVKEEVSTAVKEQGVKISDSVLSAMRSGAVTPAISVNNNSVYFQYAGQGVTFFERGSEGGGFHSSEGARCQDQ